MNKKQREWLAAKLGDLGNLAMAVISFGWIMLRPRPSIAVPIIGLCIWVICHGIGFLLLKEEEEK